MVATTKSVSARSVTIWRLRNLRERERERERERDAAQKQLQTRHANLLPAVTGALMTCMCVLRHFLMRLRTPVSAAYIDHASRGGAFVDLWRGCGLLMERRSRHGRSQVVTRRDGSVRIVRTMLARAIRYICVRSSVASSLSGCMCSACATDM